jgi:hypothetical protein
LSLFFRYPNAFGPLVVGPFPEVLGRLQPAGLAIVAVVFFSTENTKMGQKRKAIIACTLKGRPPSEPSSSSLSLGVRALSRMSRVHCPLSKPLPSATAAAAFTPCMLLSCSCLYSMHASQLQLPLLHACFSAAAAFTPCMLRSCSCLYSMRASQLQLPLLHACFSAAAAFTPCMLLSCSCLYSMHASQLQLPLLHACCSTQLVDNEPQVFVIGAHTVRPRST